MAQSAQNRGATALPDPRCLTSAGDRASARVGPPGGHAPGSPRCLGCCSGSGGSRYRTRGCTGDPWKNVACQWWPVPGARSSQKGPQRTWALWLEREQRTGTRLPPASPPTLPPPPPRSTASCRHQARPGQAGLSPGSRNWKGKLCSPAGRLPAETERRMGKTGPQEPLGDIAGPRKEAGPQQTSSHCCWLPDLPASVSSTLAAQGCGLGKGWGARAHPNPGAGPLQHPAPLRQHQSAPS